MKKNHDPDQPDKVSRPRCGSLLGHPTQRQFPGHRKLSFFINNIICIVFLYFSIIRIIFLQFSVIFSVFLHFSIIGSVFLIKKILGIIFLHFGMIDIFSPTFLSLSSWLKSNLIIDINVTKKLINDINVKQYWVFSTPWHNPDAQSISMLVNSWTYELFVPVMIMFGKGRTQLLASFALIKIMVIKKTCVDWPSSGGSVSLGSALSGSPLAAFGTPVLIFYLSWGISVLLCQSLQDDVQRQRALDLDVLQGFLQHLVKPAQSSTALLATIWFMSGFQIEIVWCEYSIRQIWLANETCFVCHHKDK